jgi:DNA repair protein RecO (recombination protein O)
MNWTDEGVVLGLRRHGETSVILEVMTRDHGRHLGLVHGGRSRRLRPVLQTGNGVTLTWRARLEEQLGLFQVEPTRMRAAQLMDSPLALYGIATLAHRLRALPEREPFQSLYESLTHLIDHLPDPDLAPALFVRFELELLADLGFGLDLTACAATGQQEDLIYVSPKTGRAVSAAAGQPYKDRLLKLPSFLTGRAQENRPKQEDIRAGLALTEFFLHQNVYVERGEAPPEERARFVALATAGDL